MALALVFANSAIAQTYLRADVGYSMMRDITLRDGDCTVSAFLGCGREGIGDGGQSPVLEVGAGYVFSPVFRADTSVGYRGFYNYSVVEVSNDAFLSTIKADYAIYTGMINGYVDILSSLGYRRGGRIRPYLTAGLGMSLIDSEGPTSDLPNNSTTSSPGSTKINFSYQAGGGIEFRVGERTNLDIGYRFSDFGKYETDAGTGSLNASAVRVGGYDGENLRAHDIKIGIRYGF